MLSVEDNNRITTVAPGTPGRPTHAAVRDAGHAPLGAARPRSGGSIVDERIQSSEATADLRDGYAMVPVVDRSHKS